MLVLKRNQNEKLILIAEEPIPAGTEIVVAVVEGGWVRIGIEAPNSVRILRGELRADGRKSSRPAAAPLVLPGNVSESSPSSPPDPAESVSESP